MSIIKIQNLNPVGINEKSILYFPKDIRIWSKDSIHVILNKTNGNWITVDDYGKFIVDSYHRSLPLPIEALIAKFAKQFELSPFEAKTIIFDLLNELLNRKFISKHKDDKCLSLSLAKNHKLRLGKLYFQVTDACNLSCRYCYNKEERKKFIKEGKLKLTTNQVVKLFNEAKNTGVKGVTFCGGEPLLEPEIVNWICHAHKIGLKTELFTRATLITENSAKRLNVCVNQFSISLDSSIPEECDFLAQRKNVFRDAIRGLEYLVKAGATQKIVIRPTVTQKNKKGALNLADYVFKKLGITRFSFTFVEDSPDKSLNLSFKEMQDLYIKFVQKSLKLYDGKNHSGEEGIKEFIDYYVYKRGGSLRCDTGSGLVMVDPYGYVYPCQGAYYPEFRSPKSLKEMSLERIYRTSPAMRKFRSLSKLEVEKCWNCDYKFWCQAYCPVRVYGNYGDFKTCPSKLKFQGEKDCVAVMEKLFWFNKDYFLNADKPMPQKEISLLLPR